MADNRKLAFDLESLKACKGYNPGFIKSSVKVKLDIILTTKQKKLLPKVDGNSDNILHYNDFSILYHEKRRLPFVVMYNINGNDKANQASRPSFRSDPRIKDECQLDQNFYDLEKKFTEFEIGHMASNNEMGRGANGVVKAYQTFHFTNSSPQSEVLNTGLWKGLESYVIKEAGRVANNQKVCVFTGPVLDQKDPPYVHDKDFQVPLVFFKVIVFEHKGGVHSTGFIISHEKRLIEHKLIPVPVKLKTIRRGEPAFTTYPYKEVFQVNIAFLEKITKLKFTWPGVIPLKVPETPNMLSVVKSVMNAGEAKKRVNRNERPITSTILSKSLSDAEIRTNNFEINMLMPS